MSATNTLYIFYVFYKTPCWNYTNHFKIIPLVQPTNVTLMQVISTWYIVHVFSKKSKLALNDYLQLITDRISREGNAIVCVRLSICHLLLLCFVKQLTYEVDFMLAYGHDHLSQLTVSKHSISPNAGNAMTYVQQHATGKLIFRKQKK